MRGSLAEVSLPELLRFLDRPTVSGRLHLYGSQAGRVVLARGRLVAVETGGPGQAPVEDPDEVVPALLDLALGADGEFEFEPVHPVANGLRGQPLSEALRELDDLLAVWRAVAAVVPSVSVVPRLVPRLQGNSLDIDACQWRVVTAIDGQRSVAELTRVTGYEAFQVCQIVQRLVAVGAAEIADGR
ncbi:MAG: DUF4388 domain-containing protein [Egibacteraceae bacterium]